MQSCSCKITLKTDPKPHLLFIFHFLNEVKGLGLGPVFNIIGTHKEYETQYLYRCTLCNACMG